MGAGIEAQERMTDPDPDGRSISRAITLREIIRHVMRLGVASWQDILRNSPP
jgi:hypothetical protein